MNKPTPTVYNIPASLSLTDILAKGLLHRHQNDGSTLSKTLILLPTRRACRSLQEAFLKQTKGKPTLLPKMQSFGDIDADELILSHNNLDQFDLPPSMSPLKRQILLAQIIEKLPNYAKSPAHNMALAQALGQLMDQIYTENLNLSDLPNIIDGDDFAEHWQITLKFLEILSESWPQILKEHGAIDAADRRNRLLIMLNDHWIHSPSTTPVLSAGSTGSIPATATLLRTISRLPQGEVILPGLDTHMQKNIWEDVEEGHPQFTLKNLLYSIEVEKEDVKIWPEAQNQNSNKNIREKLFSHVMSPAKHTDQWTKIHIDPKSKLEIENSLEKLNLYECDTPQDEANVIAVILRETLETKDKTAALITPDRDLARRVGSVCKRWGINVDDSAGTMLSNMPIGTYLNLSAQAMIDGITPVSLLSFLKHEYAAGNKFKNFRKTVREIDKTLLRGIAPPKGFENLKIRYKNFANDPKRKNKPSAKALDLLQHLEQDLSPYLEIFSKKQTLKTFIKNHIELIEKISTSDDQSGAALLWKGESGESASNLLAELYDYSDSMSILSPQDYLSILEQIMSGVTVRPKYGTHPRLMILGQLEARLIQTDVVILSGLNEGTWPPDPGNDPWMSRPMRKNYGLPLPERGITLAAHDFVQGACHEKVYVTRALRQGSAPSVPARWLQRLETFLSAIDIDPQTIKKEKHQKYVEALDHINQTTPIERPQPKPPIESRPNELSVTKIDNWLKDPYQIYASKILQLYPLEDIDKNFDAAERGNILHKIMEEFTKEFPKKIPEDAADKFIDIAKTTLKKMNLPDDIWNAWKPKIFRMADWVCHYELKWRENATFLKSEVYGNLEFKEGLEKPFTLSGRVDRIDQLSNGSYAIIDYKSGGNYSLTKIQTAELNQLPLEALILENKGFHGLKTDNLAVESLSYWKITGGREVGKITNLNNRSKIEESIETAKTGLKQLIQAYEKEETAYAAIPRLSNAPRFNDYEHLERVKEWAALDEEAEEISYG